MTKKKANVNGGSKEIDRGSWCTPKLWADRLGPFDLDPFSNPRSHIQALDSCALELGANGFGVSAPRVAGEYFTQAHGVRAAHEQTRVFLQPPYEIVLEALEHYQHTRFCALLRFDPSTEWFCRLYRVAALVCVPRRKRIEFEAPPGVEASKNPYPHAFYYARAEDAPTAILRSCFAWRTR